MISPKAVLPLGAIGLWARVESTTESRDRGAFCLFSSSHRRRKLEPFADEMADTREDGASSGASSKDQRRRLVFEENETGMCVRIIILWEINTY